MKHIQKILIVFLFTLFSLPTKAADQLIEGIDNEMTLIYALGVGVLVMFASLIGLIYLLAQVFPLFLRKRIEKEYKEKAEMAANI